MVFYQPQIDLRGGEIVSAEALVRWQHPRRGLLRPEEFMQAALDTGLIRAIDEWVLRTACRHSQEWQQRGKISVRISVNISNSLFHSDTLVSVVEQALGQTGLTPACLELELTESMVMRNGDASIAILTTLRTMGGQLSIDDFGTGYSSLSYLHRLPINRVKIDQSFILEILTQARPPMIVRAIIAMAHSLNLFVLVEGVEQEIQRTTLIDEGCDYAQGHLFGRPMPADELAEMLQSALLRKAS